MLRGIFECYLLRLSCREERTKTHVLRYTHRHLTFLDLLIRPEVGPTPIARCTAFGSSCFRLVSRTFEAEQAAAVRSAAHVAAQKCLQRATSFQFAFSS